MARIPGTSLARSLGFSELAQVLHPTQITPIVQAGKSIAYCLGKRSREEADPGRDPLDQYIGLSAAAAKLCAYSQILCFLGFSAHVRLLFADGTAGNLLQEDDPDKSVCLYLALS